MSVVYALIARQQSVLCEYTDKSGNFPTVTRVVLKHIAQQSSETATKSVFPYNEFNFFFLHEDGLTYMCMAEEQVQTNVAFAMLAELKAAFVEHYGEQGKTAIAFGMMPFAPTLDSLMKKYDNFKIDTPLSQVRHVCLSPCEYDGQAKWELIVFLFINGAGAAENGKGQDDHDRKRQPGMLAENERTSQYACGSSVIHCLMDRGEKIDLLVMRTDKLQQDALKYEKTAKKVKNVYWWKNFKYWVLIGVGLCLLAFIISFMVCGIDYSSCAARVEDSAGNELDKVGKWSKSNANKAAASVSVGVGKG